MTSLKQTLTARLPAIQQIWPVFSIIIFIDYTWVLYRFFFQVPSWLYYMKAGNLLVLFAYALSFSLIESFLVLLLVLLLCMIFPARYFKEKFIPQGSFQVLIITVLAYALRQRIEEFSKMEAWILIAIPVVAFLILTLSVIILSKIFERFWRIPKWVSSLAERMTIFLYLYPPLGVLGLLVVVVRNIFMR